MEFHFLQTDDGSPSLKLGSDAEAMHSLKGAFSETVYIYGHAISITLARGFTPSFLSLGLGLGYNELLTTASLVKNKIDLSRVRGESFELHPELTTNFVGWLRGDEIDLRFYHAYEQICSRCAALTQLEPHQIKEALWTLISAQSWHLNGPLDARTRLSQKFSCFLFDAFSSKTSPELWSEDFIASFLDKAAMESAILATYASTGSLKRALLKNQFDVEIRPGFANKRESTFAVREASK